MIDEIMCCLLSYSATYPQYPLSQLKIAAEQILNKIEEKGMLPPAAWILDHPELKDFKTLSHEWEPEDE